MYSPLNILIVRQIICYLVAYAVYETPCILKMIPYQTLSRIASFVSRMVKSKFSNVKINYSL